jgi:hypothetical protein
MGTAAGLSRCGPEETSAIELGGSPKRPVRIVRRASYFFAFLAVFLVDFFVAFFAVFFAAAIEMAPCL